MPETRDHDAAIWLLTMGDTRTIALNEDTKVNADIAQKLRPLSHQ
jgi:hypothetical protein